MSYCRDLSPVPPTREGYGRAYPDQVSGHNLVCSFLRFLVPVPEWELTTTVVGVSLVDTGPPRTSPLGIWFGVAGRVMWQWRGFDGMSLVHPNGSARPWVPWCGYSVLPLQSV